MDIKLTDNEIIKALECCAKDNCKDCPLTDYDGCCSLLLNGNIVFDLINRKNAEIERLKHSLKVTRDEFESYRINSIDGISEAIKELSEKITEIFMRYAHLHSYAEGARKDYIETVDGKEIEMQSVWDVITLQMNEMAEYEEMGRLQKNIETIEKERLLTELEKDFRLIVKEMTEGGMK